MMTKVLGRIPIPSNQLLARDESESLMSIYSTKDIVAQSFLSLDFPAQYVATMNTPALNNVGITDFYNAFCRKNGVSGNGNSNVLFTPAAILGHLYTTFLLPQQSLFDSLPKTNIESDLWGICIKKGQCGNLNQMARRMRNALGHNHFTVTKSLAFTFWDARPPANSVEQAEVIFEFTFDGLMFKFIPEWKKVVIPLLIGQQGAAPDAFGAGEL